MVFSRYNKALDVPRLLFLQVLKLTSVGERRTGGEDGTAEGGRGSSAAAAASGGSGSNLSMNQTLEGHEGSVVSTQIYRWHKNSTILAQNERTHPKDRTTVRFVRSFQQVKVWHRFHGWLVGRQRESVRCSTTVQQRQSPKAKSGRRSSTPADTQAALSRWRPRDDHRKNTLGHPSRRAASQPLARLDGRDLERPAIQHVPGIHVRCT